MGQERCQQTPSIGKKTTFSFLNGVGIKRRDRKNSSIRDSANPPEVKFNFWSDRSLKNTSIVLAIAAPALALVHSLMAMLALPFCFLVSYYLFNRVSLFVFKKEFQPPSRFVPEWDKTRKISDWIFWLLYLAFMFILLFMFGEVSDYIRNENFYEAW